MKTAEDILLEKKRDMVTVGPDQTLREALELMQTHRIGGILVKRGEKIVGIWTERDLALDILTSGFDINTARMGDYMTSRLFTAPYNTPIIKLQEMFLGLFVRHILVTRKRETAGLLSIGDVMRASLLEKDLELRKLTAIASWEYYENWGWERKWKPPK